MGRPQPEAHIQEELQCNIGRKSHHVRDAQFNNEHTQPLPTPAFTKECSNIPFQAMKV